LVRFSVSTARSGIPSDEGGVKASIRCKFL
jgi:hypothetical protein